MDTLTRPDERAAGVISGSDPYKELELYLEKVKEEIGEVFEHLAGGGGVKAVDKRPPPVPPRNGGHHQQKLNSQNQRATRARHPNRAGQPVTAWPDGILAEFNNLIAEFTTNAHPDPVPEICGGSEGKKEEEQMRYKLAQRDVPEGGAGQPVLLRAGPLPQAPPPPPTDLQPAQHHQLSHVTLTDMEESEDSGLERSAEILDSPLADNPPSSRDVDCGTQTSPTMSRSSSFTWMSDCSSVPGHSPPDSIEGEDDTTSTSSGDDPPSHRKDDPESGIGTSSPPNNRTSKGGMGGGQKCRRKETWERLRRRQSGGGGKQFVGWGDDEVWVRQGGEGGEWSSDPEVGGGAGAVAVAGAAGRRPRPTCLPLQPPPPLPHPLPPASASPLASPTSLKHAAPPLPPELTNKSSSAPLLANSAHPLTRSASASSAVMKQPRSQSERHLTEIEAAEACKWLRAAGFPQYAQMYEDLQFPIDVNAVQKDHPFLDQDSLQSLFRRLQVLNRCATMKVDNLPKPTGDDSDEDDHCALSENWTFQPESRRWSRVCDVNPQRLQIPPGSESVTPESSETPVIRYGSLPPGALTPDSELLAARFRRSGSERLRDGAKAFLRRVESLKSRRRKRQHREGIVISSPQVLDIVSMQQRMKDLNCVDVSPPASPLTSDIRGSRRLLTRPDSDSGALSDSELPWRQHYFKDANSNHTKVLEILDVRDAVKGPSGSQERDRLSPASRSGSLSTTPEGYPPRGRIVKRADAFRENEAESTESSSAIADSDSDTTPKHKGGTVVRWHSFQRASVRPDSYVGHSVCSLSSGQMLVLKKVALLKLTSIMERYCPTHRTGWNWELPKFMRKIKTPDYKDKTVFGVPLVLSLQRTGQSLPNCIQTALTWLRKNALDQVGLFRKPGVRSRIQKLKTMAEAQPDDLSYEGQQAYDVADMVKQYFRELPEALLTNKLSETFVAIFQHVPVSLRTEAMQCALLLLPDEHREALLLLLQFLGEVSAHAPTNQMTASNLAVCLAPSLFHWHPAPSRSASVSPRRKQGTPDPRELGQNKAAHDCLLALIKNHRELFTVCEELLAQCHFNYMDESVPVALEELGAEIQQDWRGYLSACTTALLKEAREKGRGWVNVSGWMGVDMSYKKVGDGHPLRLWRVSTEVEAPPTELLHRVLRERQLWDPALLKWRVVTKLEPSAEVFQYVTASMPPLPAKDYCVLRSWKTELPKGACVIVETSVEHCEGQVLSGGVRGIVLASRYLIEPCGSGRSRIMHLSRVDTKGRTPEWYNKSYGHLCALHIAKIRSSFKHTAEGPESKV